MENGLTISQKLKNEIIMWSNNTLKKWNQELNYKTSLNMLIASSTTYYLKKNILWWIQKISKNLVITGKDQLCIIYIK